jgi:PIN domain nuclease of toxin-antitoxin system
LTKQVPERDYLLDTHTAIWALDRPEALSASARRAASTGPNVLSVIVYWEVMIKSMNGRLDVGDPRVWWLDALDQLAATPLMLHPRHIAALHSLPPIHKDPFDRMLIAQATVEGLTLVSNDAAIARYASKGLRIVE